jgi:hypothetical protein
LDSHTLRILIWAEADSARPLMYSRTDLGMLAAFLDGFDKLGWIPPADDEMRQIREGHDIIMHRDGRLCFSEFCSKGGRGERDPWITIFFHLDHCRRQVRICGVEETRLYERRQTLVLGKIRYRVQALNERLQARRSRHDS